MLDTEEKGSQKNYMYNHALKCDVQTTEDYFV